VAPRAIRPLDELFFLLEEDKIMNKWKVFLYGLLIVLITNVIVIVIQSFVKGVPDSIWAAISASFGIAYIISYNVEVKDSEVSPRTQRIVNYLFTLIIVFIIIFGVSSMFNILF
jgi:hypothetical protein